MGRSHEIALSSLWKKKRLDVVQLAPETVILAEDEARLYLQATLKRVWAPRGRTPVVYASPARQKTNVYGTLDLSTGEVIATRSQQMAAEERRSHGGPFAAGARLYRGSADFAVVGPCALASG